VLNFIAQHTLGLSNVPGPDTHGFVGGCRVESIYVMLPTINPQACGARGGAGRGRRTAAQRARVSDVRRAAQGAVCVRHVWRAVSSVRLTAHSVRPPAFVMQVTILSYDGHLHLAAIVDPEVVADPELLARMYLLELAEMGKALGVYRDPITNAEIVGAPGGARA
jgi:hypothetical protein